MESDLCALRRLGIEVTPDMLAAGEDVLLSELGGAVTSNWDAADLAVSVYLAMASRDKMRNPS